MTMQLSELAAIVHGEVIGDETVVCTGASPLGNRNAGEITLLSDPRKLNELLESGASAVITPERLEGCELPQIVVLDAHQAFTIIVKSFRPPVEQVFPVSGVEPTAQVSPSASVHPTAIVGAGARIGERTKILPGVVVMPRCEIGCDCTIFPGVTLYEHTRLDDRVTIHAGSVIGANGFGYRLQEGRHMPTSQLGFVHIESDVEIGACVTIDRGTYGATRIGEGTKIDNQVMIGHNCQIGRHNLLCSQVGIAGSCTTGDYVVMAGQVGLADHLNIGDRAVLAAQSGVMEDCESDKVYLGSPATTQREQMRIEAVKRRLPEIRSELKRLRKEMQQLQDLQPPSDSDAQRAA